MEAAIAHPAFLREIRSIDESGLVIVVEERTARGPLEPDELGLAFEGREIVSSTTDRVLEISWSVVVCFAVRGDHFPKGSSTSATISEGDPNSAFIRWVKAESNTGSDYLAFLAGHDDDDRPLRHWIVSTNGVHFDVASPYAPEVTPR
jgi:hypothetical protein